MIGKRSKFKDHAENIQLQDSTQEDKSTGAAQKVIGNCENNNDIIRGTTEDRQNRSDITEFILTGEINNTEEPALEAAEEIEAEGEESIAHLGEYDASAKSENKQRDTTPRTSEDKKGDNASSKISILVAQNTKSDTDLLWDEICNGVQGKNSGIPMGFNRLNKYLGLRKSIYTTIGAAAGCGKTSLVDCAYVLNPYDWYIKNKNKSKVKFEVIYFSMERKKTYKLAKWLCMKIWQEEKILMTTDELLSWQSTLTKRKQEVSKFYIDNYFKEMTQSGVVTILDGQQNPTGIYKFLHAHALKKGREVPVSQWENRYIADDDNLITNIVHDHAGKTKNENIGGKYEKKLSIDKASEYYCWARDYLGYSPIMINQFNRTSYADIQFSKKEGGDPDPTVEYWKDSGNVIEDCDVAISLFNPYKYNLEEYMGYNVNDFTDPNGNNKFRGLKIIKNSYGTDNLRIGLAFLGEVSLFKEMTKADKISQKEINSIVNNDYFSF